jgi:hypothetical protein
MVKPICDANVISSIVPPSPKTTTSSVHSRHCLAVVNTVPPGFVFTFLITFSRPRLNKSLDKALPYFGPITITKAGDNFPWIFTLFIAFSNIILTSYLVFQTLS